jgi:lia operon protein LiaG
MSLRSPALALALATVACVSATERAGAQTERRTLSGNAVSIFNLVGAVSVEPGTGSEVVVEVTLRGMDARRLRTDVVSEGTGQSLRIIFPEDDLVYPELGRNSRSEFTLDRDGRWDRGRDGWWPRPRRIRVSGNGRGTEAWADLKIFVPAGKRVDVNVGVGFVSSRAVSGDLSIDVASAKVRVDGHTGTLRLDTGSGGAEARDIKGDELRVDVGSGHVTVLGADVQRMTLESGSGSVEVDRATAQEITVDVGSGGLRVSRATADRIRLETGSGSVNVELTNSPKALDVESGSGGVTLLLPGTLDAEIDISTGSGGIDSDFPVSVNRMERHRLRGVVGKGTGRIRVETGSGSVRLRRM